MILIFWIVLHIVIWTLNVDDISHLISEDVEYVFSEEKKSITTQEIGKLLDLKVRGGTNYIP